MSWGDFFYMGGYWPYVWASYGIAAVVLALNVVVALRRARAVRRRLAESHRHRGRTS